MTKINVRLQARLELKGISIGQAMSKASKAYGDSMLERNPRLVVERVTTVLDATTLWRQQ
jgi:hypothetical protein